jgi:hypothetical protein
MPNRIGTEIEIKVSKGDLKRDLKKQHEHYDPRICCLYFAGPIELEEAFFEYVPKEAGIITVFTNKAPTYGPYQCTIRRRAKRQKNYRAFTDEEITMLLRLGNMRYWSLFSKQFKGVEK